jgi:hypothetical protein
MEKRSAAPIALSRWTTSSTPSRQLLRWEAGATAHPTTLLSLRSRRHVPTSASLSCFAPGTGLSPPAASHLQARGGRLWTPLLLAGSLQAIGSKQKRPSKAESVSPLGRGAMSGIGRRTPAPSTPTPEAVVRRRPALAWPPSVDRLPLRGAEQPSPGHVGSLHDSPDASVRRASGRTPALNSRPAAVVEIPQRRHLDPSSDPAGTARPSVLVSWPSRRQPSITDRAADYAPAQTG